MGEHFYITTPIYYVNADPHLGHAYTTILADSIARYHCLFGKEVYFLTGTDEHGQKVQAASLLEKISPQAHCDKMFIRFKDLWDKLGIEYSDFIRTTEERHKKVVREILNAIYMKGDIYLDEFEGWYCVHDERFFNDKDLQEGNCPLCERPAQRMREKNYFFKMSKYQRWLVDYIDANPDFIRPEHKKNEVLGFLRQPLKDLCISRPVSRLGWGIPLPFDGEYVTYVWFDALLNYYSAVKDDDRWPASLHLIGKDILTTHSVYWPIMLKAAGLEMPKTIFAHGWWLIDQTKMSKSLGNVVRPMEMAEVYGVDAFRYFLMREMTPGHDSSFSEDLLIKRINDDLANDLGNLLSRVTTLIYKFFEGNIPVHTGDDEEWLRLSSDVVDEIKNGIENLRIDEVVQAAMKPVNNANRYLEENAPWKLAKTDQEKAGNVLYNALEALRFSAVALSPVMPGKSAEILTRFQAEKTGLVWGQLQSGMQIQKGAALFPRIEKKIEAARKIEEKLDSLNLISIDDFKKVKLCVAQVLSAETVEGADKLLKLKIDIGKETRQLVAGIAKHYTCESLIGKKIIVITNLQKAVIRGVESQGMLLAAGKGKKMTLLTIDQDIPIGATIS